VGCAVKRSRFDLITREAIVSVANEGETGGVSHGRPDEHGGRRPEGHQAELTDGDSLLQEGDDDTEMSAAVSRCARPHTSLQHAGAAVLTPSGLPRCPTVGGRSSAGTDAVDGQVAGRVVVGVVVQAEPHPRTAMVMVFPSHRSARASTRRVPEAPRVPVVAVARDRRTAEPSATNRRNRPWGRARSRTRAFSAAACSTAEVMTSLATRVASSWVVAEPQPHTSRTLSSTRRVAQGACGVGGRSMRTGTVLIWSWRSERPVSGWARAA
jgi:hypothetical protein